MIVKWACARLTRALAGRNCLENRGALIRLVVCCLGRAAASLVQLDQKLSPSHASRSIQNTHAYKASKALNLVTQVRRHIPVEERIRSEPVEKRDAHIQNCQADRSACAVLLGRAAAGFAAAYSERSSRELTV